jgi:hypothetical protein
VKSSSCSAEKLGCNLRFFSCRLAVPTAENFFPILAFLIIILEMNPMKYFFNLTFLSRVNPSDVTYEGVDLVRASSPGATQGAGACPVVTLIRMVPRRISHDSQVDATDA